MAITFVQASNPYWYFSDRTGKPAGAGQVYFYSSLNPDADKTVYQDSAGLLPYPQPINISLNGTVPPIYFAVNSSDPTDNYDIYAYDKEGNEIEQINNFSPPSGSGGGGTTVLNLNNLIVNNVMYRNIGSLTPTAGVNLIAPGVHQGLSLTSSNYGPDIAFIKNNASATDAISFPVFALGLLPMSPSDVTPYDYFNYVCTGAGSGETSKFVNFPITSKVQNLSNQTVSGTIWGVCTSGNTALTVNVAQFFGDGSSASSTVITPLATITLTNTWQQYNFSAAIPSVALATLGQCGNDGLFLQVGLPLNATTNIGFTKPTLYLGDHYSVESYTGYDEISGIVEAPRTGDFRIAMNSFHDFGWVPMNDGVIGDAGTAVPGVTNTRLNLDTFPLYNLIWSTLSATQTLAPMYTRAGSPVAYGATPIADWSAGNVISLTKQAGRLIGNVGIPSSGNNTGNNWFVGLTAGNEQTNEVAAHTHTYVYSNLQSGGSNAFQGGPNYQNTNVSGTTNSTGVAEVNIQNPVVYQNFFMKL